MAYTTVPVEKFSGLDTNGDGGAVDVLNVRVDDSNRLQVRNGYVSANATTQTGTPVARGILYDAGYDTTWFLHSAGVRIYDSALTTIIDRTKTGLTGSMVTQGGGVFAACETDTIQSIAPTGAGSVITGNPDAPFSRFLTWMPSESRLVSAYSDFGVLNSQRVVFSDPEATAWTPTSFVELQNQDYQSDVITGAATWRDLVFVFKTREFFVFSGSSVTASGVPQFNYQTIDVGVGCVAPDPGSTVAARDGVYFIGRDGIYRTQGGPPELVSGALRRWWGGFDSDLFDVPVVAREQASPTGRVTSLSADEENVYAITSNGYVFVYSLATEQWSVNLYANSPEVMTRYRDLRDLLFISGEQLWHSSDGQTSDAGTAISSRYQLDFNGLGSEGEKVLREITLDGTGTVKVGVATNYETANPTTTSVTLGSAPQLGQGRHRTATRGRNFSCVLEGTTAWDVERLVYKLRDTRSAK